MHLNDDNVIYFVSFGVEHTPNKVKKFIGNKNTKRNIYRIQTYNSIICGVFCIAPIDFMLKYNIFLNYTNLFFLTNIKNVKIILKYFQ